MVANQPVGNQTRADFRVGYLHLAFIPAATHVAATVAEAAETSEHP